MLQQLISSVSR